MSGKYQAYPEYKDSAVAGISTLPAHWAEVPLKHVATCNDGVLPENTDPDFEFHYIDISSVSKTEGVTRTEKLKFSAAPSRARRVVKSGDVIVSTVRTYLEAIAPISHQHEGMVASTGFAVIRPTRLESTFAQYALRAQHFIDEVVARSTGVSYPAINASDLVCISTPVPPIQEQRTIAAFLDQETARIDRLIEKQQRLIELLKEKRQAVISHAVTKGLDPDVPMKDSGVEWLGQVPEHWGLPKLIHVTTRIGDGLHSTPVYEDGTGYYFVNGNNFSAGIIKLGPSSKEVPESEYHKHHTPLDHSTVLMSINGTIGNLALYRSEPVILGKSACYINCGHELDRRFLLGFLRSNEIDHYFDTEVTGTTIYNLSLNSVRQMRVCLPPRTEQDEIVRYCEQKDQKFERLIGHAAKAVELLQERRTALISAAVTGKIDVRNWQPNTSTQTTEPDLPMAAEQAGRYHV